MLIAITGCSSSKVYNIYYDDIMLYVTPTTSAHPGDVVQVIVTAREGASFVIFMDALILSQQDVDGNLIIYEFTMPAHDVSITHQMEEQQKMNTIQIPASMSRHRISYETEYAFSGQYMVVTNPDEANTLFAGFSLAHADKIEPYPNNFFDTNIIIAFVKHEGSGSIGHSLKSATVNSNTLTLTINREVPYIGTCDMASWLCLVSVSKSMLPHGFVTQIAIIDKEV
jgi:hypothetical protein